MPVGLMWRPLSVPLFALRLRVNPARVTPTCSGVRRRKLGGHWAGIADLDGPVALPLHRLIKVDAGQ